jgi:hypothetical protein
VPGHALASGSGRGGWTDPGIAALKRECLGCGRPTRGSYCASCEAKRRAPYTDPAYRRAARSLYGRPCELKLPGCTGIADTAQHVVPIARGRGRGPLVPACRHCNSSLQDREP